jgi:DNA methylase
VGDWTGNLRVIDAFLGSGTTLAAAELTERVCYGLEIDPKYIDTVIIRWQNLTGGKATLDDDGRTFEPVAASAGRWQCKQPNEKSRRC